MVRKKIKTKVSLSTKCPFVFHSRSSIRKLLMTMVLIIASVSFSMAQVSDTLAFADSRSSRVKYLKSMAIEEQEKCEKASFLENFDIDLTLCKEAMIIEKSQFKKAPGIKAENCKVEVPLGSIVKLYNYYPEEKYWAVKYENKWGFLPDASVKRFD